MKKNKYPFKALCAIIACVLSFSINAQNTALNFDGTDDYIQTDYAGISGNAARTVEAWIKTDIATSVGDQQVIIDWGTFSGAGRFTFNLLSSNSIRIEAGGGSFLNATTAVNDNQWHHVAITYDPDAATNNTKLYIDGELDVEGNLSSVNTGTAQNLRIGARIDDGFGYLNSFTGNIDEVRIWDIALTQTEIDANMNSELCAETPNLMAYFKMNGGTPEADNTAITSISDNSGNEYAGMLNDFALTGTTSNFVTGASITVLESIDNSFTTSETTITANQAGAVYQWVDCDNANAAIEGETNQSFTPSEAGNYAVEITMNTCTIISECINFGPGGACIDPSDLTVGDVFADTAAINWTANSGETEWVIAYGEPGFTPETATQTFTDDDTTAGETLTGLNPQTTYEVYVQAVCGEGNESEWIGPVNFTTTCGAIINFPFTEDFEGTEGFDLPDCWLALNENDDLDYWNTTLLGSESTRTATIYTNYNNGDNDDYLVSPQFTLTGNEQLVFRAKSIILTDLNDVKVMLSTSGTAAEDFTEELMPLTVVDSNVFQQYTINLDNYTGNVYIAFYIPSGGLDGNRLYIDDVTVRTIPTCLQPTDLEVPSANGDSANISFVAGEEETEWEIAYGAPDFNPDSEGETLIDDDGVTTSVLEGLDPQTEYDVYIRAICSEGNESYWTGPTTFTTGCASVNTFPYLENFNNSSYNIPDCWSVLNENNDSDYWKMYNLYGIDGSFSAGFYSDNNNGNNDDYLVSPQITLTGNEQLKFSVRARTDEPEDANDFKVVLSTTGSNAASFTEELLPITEVSSTVHQDYIIDLSDYVGEVYIAIHIPAEGLDGYYLYLDNFTVRTIPSCTEPSQLNVTSLTGETADLTWNAGNDETEWEIAYGETGFDPETAGETAIDDDGQAGMTLENLEPQTTYDFYVKSVCGEGDESIWAGPYSFTTACAIINTFPYVEDFSSTSGSDLPLCWSIINNNGDYDIWKTFTVYANNNNRTTGLFTNYNNGNNDDYLVSPQINLIDDKELVFMARSSNADNPNDVSVLLSTTGTEIEDFTEELMPTTIVDSEEYQEYIIDLSAYTEDNVYIAFYVAPNGADGGYIYMDDFTIRDLTTCPKPSDLEVVPADNAADLTWVAGGEETQWEMIYGAPGFDPETEGTVTTDDDGIIGGTVEGLTPETDYEVYVRAYCAEDDQSFWVGPVAFTTIELQCHAPSDIVAEDVTENTANITWQQYGEAFAWGLKYGAPGFNPDTEGTSVEDIDGEIGQVLSTLTSATSYDVYVRAYCNEEEISGWAGPVNFTTLEEEICETPSNIGVDNITQTSANISWTENGDAEAWEILYGETGFNPQEQGTLVEDNDGELGVVLENLTADTAYQVYLRSKCGEDDFSEWTTPFGFTTEALSLADKVFEGFSYYPNPVKERLTLSATSVINQITIYNLLGQKVIEQHSVNLSANINLSHLETGAYLMKVEVDGAVKTFRIIKE